MLQDPPPSSVLRRLTRVVGASVLVTGVAAGVAFGFWPRELVQRISPPKVGYWHGDRALKQVALTFDDGPDDRYTGQILDILAQKRVPGTFFLLGKHAQAYPELVRRMIREGHAIGSHGFSHRNLESMNRAGIRREMEDSSEAIESACGVRPDLFRAPYGAADRKVIQEANRMGYAIVQWTFSPKDWSAPSNHKLVQRIVRRARNGSIILLHDGSPDGRGNRESTVAALPDIISALQAEGFELVTVPELIDRSAQPRQLAHS